MINGTSLNFSSPLLSSPLPVNHFLYRITPIALPSIALHCTVLYYTALHCTVLLAVCVLTEKLGAVFQDFGDMLTQALQARTVPYCAVLHYTVYYAALYCAVLYCTVLYCTVLYCTVLYTMLQCILYHTALYILPYSLQYIIPYSVYDTVCGILHHVECCTVRCLSPSQYCRYHKMRLL